MPLVVSDHILRRVRNKHRHPNRDQGLQVRSTWTPHCPRQPCAQLPGLPPQRPHQLMWQLKPVPPLIHNRLLPQRMTLILASPMLRSSGKSTDLCFPFRDTSGEFFGSYNVGARSSGAASTPFTPQALSACMAIIAMHAVRMQLPPICSALLHRGSCLTGAFTLMYCHGKLQRAHPIALIQMSGHRSLLQMLYFIHGSIAPVFTHERQRTWDQPRGRVKLGPARLAIQKDDAGYLARVMSLDTPSPRRAIATAMQGSRVYCFAPSDSVTSLQSMIMCLAEGKLPCVWKAPCKVLLH